MQLELRWRAVNLGAKWRLIWCWFFDACEIDTEIPPR